MNRFQFSMSDLHRIIVAEANNGKSVNELIVYLQSRGWTQEAARHFVENALHTQGTIAQEVTAKAAKQQLPVWMPVVFWLSALTGLLWMLVDVAGRLPT